MKKILGLFTLIAMVLFASCSTSEEAVENSAIQKTNVIVSIDQPNTGTNATGKQIKRKNIPVWVKTIDIKATSNVFTNYFTGDNFTFDEQNGVDFISLNNVATGANTFVATTTTDSPQFYQLTNFTSNASTVMGRFDAGYANINKENPYVLYSGSTVSTINPTGSNAVSIPMTTNNGRLLTVFQLKQNLKDLGLQAKITASVEGAQNLTAITKGNELVTFKWSDVKSINNAEVTYKVEISGINTQQTILETYYITQNVVASSSLWCFYELDFKGYVMFRDDIKITLNWQEWKTQQCPTCSN